VSAPIFLGANLQLLIERAWASLRNMAYFASF
jgi:hypothetical protein